MGMKGTDAACQEGKTSHLRAMFARTLAKSLEVTGQTSYFS